MKQVGLWHVTDAGPKKLPASSLELESQLEEWIEGDPGLLENGLTIVGRQVRVEAGLLDLLAVDPQGRWAVIELKRGALYRETLAQALDYAACISAMPHELLAEKVNEYLGSRLPEAPGDPGTLLRAPMDAADRQEDSREVRVFLVGTGRDHGLERLANFLSGTHGVPISVVSFEVYKVGERESVLVRELTESEVGPLGPAASAMPTVEELCARADQGGIGVQFRTILETATRHELYPRPFKHSLMFAPPSNHTRSLFTIWADPPDSGEVWFWLGPEAFAQFFPLTEQEVVGDLGEGGWRRLQAADVSAFVAGLDRVFRKLDEPQ